MGQSAPLTRSEQLGAKLCPPHTLPQLAVVAPRVSPRRGGSDPPQLRARASVTGPGMATFYSDRTSASTSSHSSGPASHASVLEVCRVPPRGLRLADAPLRWLG